MTLVLLEVWALFWKVQPPKQTNNSKLGGGFLANPASKNMFRIGNPIYPNLQSKNTFLQPPPSKSVGVSHLSRKISSNSLNLNLLGIFWGVNPLQ